MPRVTPLEIQKHEFSRKWKGIDPVEVESFLAIIADEMEELARANSELDTRVRQLQVENAEHRERKVVASREEALLGTLVGHDREAGLGEDVTHG